MIKLRECFRLLFLMYMKIFSHKPQLIGGKRTIFSISKLCLWIMYFGKFVIEKNHIIQNNCFFFIFATSPLLTTLFIIIINFKNYLLRHRIIFGYDQF